MMFGYLPFLCVRRGDDAVNAESIPCLPAFYTKREIKAKMMRYQCFRTPI